MRKMVILTEGQTEQIFISELIASIGSTSPYKLEAKKLLGGKRFATVEMEISFVTNTTSDPEFYILILDCASDGRVVSALKERYAGFVEQSFEQMIIIRDLRPDFEFDERSKVEEGISKQIPQQPICPVLVLATMEVEAWFIAEIGHFPRIDASLDEDTLRGHGISIGMEFEKIPEPAKKLSAVYESVGVTYGKSKDDVTRTVNAVDKKLYFSAFTDCIPSVKPMMEAISSFFEPDPRVITERSGTV